MSDNAVQGCFWLVISGFMVGGLSEAWGNGHEWVAWWFGIMLAASLVVTLLYFCEAEAGTGEA